MLWDRSLVGATQPGEWACRRTGCLRTGLGRRREGCDHGHDHLGVVGRGEGDHPVGRVLGLATDFRRSRLRRHVLVRRKTGGFEAVPFVTTPCMSEVTCWVVAGEGDTRRSSVVTRQPWSSTRSEPWPMWLVSSASSSRSWATGSATSGSTEVSARERRPRCARRTSGTSGLGSKAGVEYMARMAPVLGSMATAETGADPGGRGMASSAVCIASCTLGRTVRATLSVTVLLVRRSRNDVRGRLWAARYWL